MRRMAATVFFAVLTLLSACAPTIMQMSLAPADAETARAAVRKDAVLQAYFESGTVAGAARTCGISQQTFYRMFVAIVDQ